MITPKTLSSLYRDSHYKFEMVARRLRFAISNWIIRNKLQWNLNPNTTIVIQENEFESVVCKIAAAACLISHYENFVNSIGRMRGQTVLNWPRQRLKVDHRPPVFTLCVLNLFLKKQWNMFAHSFICSYWDGGGTSRIFTVFCSWDQMDIEREARQWETNDGDWYLKIVVWKGNQSFCGRKVTSMW